jgi:hypothetical protein
VAVAEEPVSQIMPVVGEGSPVKSPDPPAEKATLPRALFEKFTEG